ncbi:DNA polymerase IV [Ornithinibacillus halophilus]|uniref:DNA polymerase IV n=1 Tax=Ornithinibacillus halophilus TaxID=930117 RepID=A0A1M5CW25_9BACI|nr:DNA polymerase IV [Ornithinibacillus halophilus]SHF58856.1 DNA polymerase-4 [Ornithinibacillus halophilus]
MSIQKNKARIIFHIDMNCFYASVEMAYNTDLKGKPVAIAGNPEERKGIIVTSSYEARAKGVKTTMPLWQARKLCPNLIVMRPNFERYRAASNEIFRMLFQITPYVEPVSIDEGYMDVTEVEGNPVELAYRIQNDIMNNLDIPCSIGIAPNKFLAKMASDMKKPLGITILRKRDIEKKLWPLPVEEMYGVGSKTAEKLRAMDVKTIKDLAYKDEYMLKQAFGINGQRLKSRANGKDLRPVDPDAVHDFKSIGSSQTLPHDTTDEKEIFHLIDVLSDNVERRLKRKEAAGRSIQLMIRYHDRKTITRSKKLPSYIEYKEDIKNTALELWTKNWNTEPVRLIGVTVQDVIEKKNLAEQLDLFTYEKEEKKDKLYSTIQQLSNKYGKETFKKLNNEEEKDSEFLRTSFQKDFLDDFRK